MFYLLRVTNFFSMGEDLLSKWLSTLDSFWNWTVTFEVSIFGTTWYLWEIFFGLSLISFAILTVTKYLIDVVT